MNGRWFLEDGIGHFRKKCFNFDDEKVTLG